MKNYSTFIKYAAILLIFISFSQIAIAQPPPPGPATGAPIDGLSGLIALIVSAIFGKKFFNKKEK